MHRSARGDKFLRHDAERIAEGTQSHPSDRNVFGMKALRASNRRQMKKLLLTRQHLAKRIKAIRSGAEFPDAATRTGLQRQAVLTTHVRNFMKRKG